MKRFYFYLCMCWISLPLMAQSEWQIRVSPQAAFGAKNTVQRPNNSEGTRVHLNKEFNRVHTASFSPRIELEYSYKRHHGIATAAFLQDKFEGTSDRDILYDEILFPTGNFIETKYKFNTYRVGYRYRLVDRERFAFELGATLLIRDAYIELQDESERAKYSNVGVAPLLSYYLEWKADERLSLFSYGDAFAIKAGRAEDLFAGAKYRFTDKLYATAGYRLLEGGSDGDRVYTMAFFHFISLGLGVVF